MRHRPRQMPSQDDPADEPSISSVPQVVDEIFEIVKDPERRYVCGRSWHGYEHQHGALKYATYGYIMETGRIVMDDAACCATTRTSRNLFGIGGEGRKSFREVKKATRRSKRWPA